jgi:hypothetical protein
MAVEMTLAELAGWLDPPMSVEQLEAAVTAIDLPPSGTRKQPRGRPARTWDAGLVIRLHAALVPFAHRECRATPPAAHAQAKGAGCSSVPG